MGKREASPGYAKRAEALKEAINRFFWREKAGTYSYLLYPDGRRDHSQEGCGISFAVLTGVCEGEQAKR